MAKVHYWELSNYNNHVLVGKWFDLDNMSHDEHLEEIEQWLAELSVEHIEALKEKKADLLKDLDNLSDEEKVKRLRKLDSIKWDIEHLQHVGYEEVILGDVEEVPDRFVGEWSIDEEFFELQEAIENSHLDAEVFEAGIECGIPIDKIEDAYYGYFESDEALADEYIDSGCMGDIPEYLENYIDTERLGRDLAMDFIEFNGHYFYANY